MTKMQDFIAGRTPPELYETYLTPGLFTPFAQKISELASPRQTCLDVACGTGIVSRSLAEKHGDTITIKAVDVAPPMLEVAKRLSPAANIEHHLASADDLPFEDDYFDVAFCQQGFQFFPDQEKALHEIRRVLKPGGALALSVWPFAADMGAVFGAFERAVIRHLGEDLAPLGPFSFGSLEKLGALAREEGFQVEKLETQTLDTTLPGIEDLVLFDVLFLGRPAADGSLQPVLGPDDPDGDRLIDRMVSDMTDELGGFIGSDGRLYAPASTHFLLARK